MVKEKKEKSLQEQLKDPAYVNYNMLVKLEEIKRINFAILESMNALLNSLTEEPRGEREGVFKNK